MTSLSGAAQRLDPLTLPLAGSRLIEASAGTGKTWTIAALYLRLVLGHGDAASRPPRALAPGEILVMTFTRAATRELSDRIRTRLAEAAMCFRGEAEPAAQDDFLRALIAAYPEDAAPDADAPTPGAPRSRLAAAHRLALAAEAMDDAAVHTIDAWCQRMLLEHAFDSGQRFDEELVADELSLQRAALHDYWRREVYPLAGAPLEAVLRVWPGVDALAQQLRGLLGQREALGNFEGRALSLGDWVAQWQDGLAALKAPWAERAVALRDWLQAQCDAKVFNGTRLRAQYFEPWCAALADWAEDPEALEPELGAGRLRLTPDGLAQALAKGRTLPALPPEIDLLAGLFQALDARVPLREALLRHAADGVERQLAQLKRRSGCFGFADLQARLDAALAGPAGPRLRERIVGQYPAVLIDEFQDTSPLQYRLFDRLYDVAADARETLLLLIGDPKQSIYGFRGADIYSYLAARQATAGRQHVLGTNYRSTEALVAAVNQIFAQAEAGWPGAAACLDEVPDGGLGAFALPRTGRHALPFESVRAQGRRERLVARGDDGAPATLPALTLQWLPAPLPAQPLRRAQARLAAATLVGLLNDPQAGFADADGGWRRLGPGDIAVLVRNRREAQAMRRELQKAGVPSVYLSDQDSVLRSIEAVDLLRWLQAVADPLEVARVRTAYAGATFGLDAADLQALRDDEDSWEARQGLLLRLRGVWQRQGVLAMLLQTLHALELPARWLAEPAGPADGAFADPARRDGERRLTNWLHLAELLQGAAATLQGEQALIRWLAEEIQADAASADERILRLESDAELVQVVTVHKSKGLEYPLVFLPFAQAARPVDRRGRQMLELPQDAGAGLPPGAATGQAGRRIDFRLGKAELALADAERLREELRLLYVALTRARHALWLGVGLPARGTSNQLHVGALGHLLGAGQKMTPGQAEALLQGWAAADPGTRLQRFEALPDPGGWQRPRASTALPPPPEYRATFARDWGVGSFSALVRDLAPMLPAAVAVPVEEAGGVRAPVGDLDPAGPAGPAGVDELDPIDPVGPVERPERRADALRVERWREELRSASAQGVAVDGDEATPAAQPWHRFPRGALPGNFLHDQLEWLAQEGEAGGLAFADPADPAVQAVLRRRCARAGHGERSDGLLDWLQALLATPLPPLRAPLRDLPARLPEMEFWMPAERLDSARLDALCRAHLLPGRERPALQPRVLNGLLMGFADLVFEHDGRWWVLDYKSNALGEDDAAYTPAALEAAMLAHRYELQAALYLLALHRLLRARLGAAYDPAQHLGGAVYLFLRGIAASGAGCVHLRADAALLEALDQALHATPTAEGSA
ncbi:MAG: exodeoxyribonuclease V subunit beta [Burkholderiaceae bacterium]|nr:exodeoxyribonuclease V subunit beta [Burkholderiaceae bacterium]